LKKSKGRVTEIPPTPLLLGNDVTIRLTGAGDLIDVRYKVEKEMNTPGPVFLQDETTGKIATIVAVPRIGRLMSRKSKVNHIAYGIFINPDESIKVGSPVTLVVGGTRKEHIIVR
jgi:hypothetical protein